MSSGNVMEEERPSPLPTKEYYGSQEAREGSQGYYGSRYVEHGSSKAGKSNVGTPTMKQERRSVEVERIHAENGGSPVHHTHLRAPRERLLHAAGPRTFDNKYMPFAAGFAHMADEAPVYRSTRLHTINPTAAVTDDISFYYTLDSGKIPPAVVAANPETSAEFVRNTATQSHGGLFRRLMKSIE